MPAVSLSRCLRALVSLVPSRVMFFSDVVNTKVYPQKRRKRELAGASNFSKNEHPRKWNVQKAKDTIKRPRAKGQYHGSTEENTKVCFANMIFLSLSLDLLNFLFQVHPYMYVCVYR